MIPCIQQDHVVLLVGLVGIILVDEPFSTRRSTRTGVQGLVVTSIVDKTAIVVVASASPSIPIDFKDVARHVGRVEQFHEISLGGWSEGQEERVNNQCKHGSVARRS
jgi:hypothetical protein